MASLIKVNKSISGNSKRTHWLIPTIFGSILIMASLLLMGTWSAKASSLDGSKTSTTPQEKQVDPSNPSSTDSVQTLFQEGFESNSLSYSIFYPPTPTCPTNCGWRTVADIKHTGVHAAWAPGPAGTSDQQLSSNVGFFISPSATEAILSFWHSYSFEQSQGNYYDGGVLEVSSDSGATWSDSGFTFLSGGYNATLHAGTNPLAGRPAWGGQQATFTQVQANLIAYAGHTIYIRFHEGTDSSTASPGWWVDDVQMTITSSSACTPVAWHGMSPYPTNIFAPASAVWYGYFLSFGGISNASTVVATTYAYHTPSTSWAAVAPLPSARYFASAVTNDAYVYIIGGFDSTSHSTATVWRYDLVANTYTPMAPLNHPVAAHATAILNGKIYVIGGLDTTGHPVNTVQVYTISTDSWADTTPYPTTINKLSAVTYSDYIYAMGGFTTGSYSQKAYRFDESTSTWNDVAIADPPTQYAHISSANGMVNGRWVVAGGFAAGDAEVIAWDPATNTWAQTALMNPYKYAPGFGIVGGVLYAFGGRDYSGYPSSSGVFYNDMPCTPPALTPTSTPTAGGPTPTVCPIHFIDVEQGNTFYSNIRCLACRGIVTGYEDGTFRPNNDITRGQLAKIVSNSAGFHDDQNTQLFEDIPLGSTFYSFIGRLASRGFMNGYPCGSAGEPCGASNLPYFRPNANASRGQISKIVSNTASFSDVQSAQLFQDVPMGSTFHDEIGRLSTRSYMNGYPCGGPGEPCGASNLPYFRPASNATRGQSAKIVGNTFFPNCQTPFRPEK